MSHVSLRPVVLPFVLTASALLAACASTDAKSGEPASPDRAPVAATKSASPMDADLAYLKPGGMRSFSVDYVAKVPEVPAGTKTLRIWLPVPSSTNLQTIDGLDFGGGKPTIGTEAKYGNKIACFEIPNPGKSAEVSMHFAVARAEQVTDLAALATDGKENDPRAAMFLKDDKLTIVDDRIRKMAAEVTKGKTTTLEKARAIYEHVAAHMSYDKTGQGWGRGDTNFACDVGKGNCTDFHALFMSLCRASNIPAGFEIGLYLPYEPGKKETPGGYHCWSFFRVPGKAWVPVDISEADRMPERKDYFFGAHTPNRVTMSVGRDLVLVPPQAGAPLNYLLNPYAEADGKEVKSTKDWNYTEL